MHSLDWMILGGIIVLVNLAIRYMWHHRGQPCGGCSGGCANCTGCTSGCARQKRRNRRLHG